eukprot:TRINITY_DN101487_c0_g1_i1.p2 TRINITY_DN101487_c0_g1~~TRINITY_DN101487_c0_g1_i1.p2  ORF type:complete len:113 (+),score=4.26 TRINITY_DN101487_c0_g1_i1:26-340(+)
MSSGSPGLTPIRTQWSDEASKCTITWWLRQPSSLNSKSVHMFTESWYAMPILNLEVGDSEDGENERKLFPPELLVSDECDWGDVERGDGRGLSGAAEWRHDQTM